MEDQDSLNIDIGRYVEVLFRQWRLIIGFFLIFVIAAVLVAVRKPDLYQANVLVASTKLTSVVSLGSTIETLSEEQLDSRFVNIDARLQSYVQMVDSPAIASAVIEALGDQLPENDRNIANLLGRVNGSVVTKSDSIEIVVTHPDPEVAALIANAWGEAYVEHVNQVYSGSGFSESYQATRREKEASFATYQEAQSKLEEFLADNQVPALERQIAERETLISDLSTTRGIAATTVISNTMIAQLTTYNEHLLNQQERLSQAYYESRRVSQLLMDAQDMRRQVEEGGAGAAASNTLALTLLKAQVFAANDEGLGNLQIQANPVVLSSEEMVADLASLIRTLEERLTALDYEIQFLTEQLLKNQVDTGALGLNAATPPSARPNTAQSAFRAFEGLAGLDGILGEESEPSTLDSTLSGLETSLNQLEAAYARENNWLQELTRARDLAWETYKNLAIKEAELKVAAQTKGTEVALASSAAVPQNPISMGSRDIQIAALAGLLLGVTMAYLIEFWWGYRGIEPFPISITNLVKRTKPKVPVNP